MVNLRLYTPDDYPMVCEWWKSWGWPIIPETNLPAIGLIVEVDSIPAACVWLFRMECQMAWMEFLISNKAVRGQKRKDAINLLIDSMCVVASALGFKSVQTITNSASLGSTYTRRGFRAYDQNITHFLKEV